MTKENDQGSHLVAKLISLPAGIEDLKPRDYCRYHNCKLATFRIFSLDDKIVERPAFLKG